jgi:agmatine deiminase
MDFADSEFRTLVETIATFEPVKVLVNDAEHARRVAAQLKGPARAHPIELLEVPTDDAWMRDIGPTFVEDPRGCLLAIDWTFNSWGGKYPPWELDDATASRVAELAGVPSQRVKLVVEGGALEVDGQGTLLATRPSLLCETRNPGIDEARMERQLSELLGVSRVVWLDGGIEGDDTDGHIDDIARFVGPTRVVCAVEHDLRDPNHAVLAACRARLLAARDARGRAFQVIDLPMPPPVEARGERLPASYANFYILNGAVLVPTFGVSADAEALELLNGLFPDRVVRGVPCGALVRGLGAVHCLTQQQPAEKCRL